MDGNSSKAALDPIIAAMERRWHESGIPGIYVGGNGPVSRERARNIRALLYPKPVLPAGKIERTDITGPNGPITVQIVRPREGTPTGTLVYFHGGGFMIGDIDSHQAHAIRFANTARVVVVNVDYRLAPEHPFPAAVDDATKAYRWLLQMGFATKRMAIAGDSAGGGLTIATLVNLRDQKVALPACAVAISPWVDLEGVGTSMTARAAQDPMVQKAGLDWMASMYLKGKDPKTPLAAPLHANLEGLPPILVQVGSAETLLDDATRIAEKLHTVGVEVKLSVWPNQLHVFPFFAPILSEGRDGCLEIGAFIRGHTA
jgi:epsilon-lactone hydrolase